MGKLRSWILLSMLWLFLGASVAYAKTDEATMLEQGTKQYQAGNYYYASTWLERLLKQYPRSAQRQEVLLMLANSYCLSGRDERALGTLRTLLKENPKAAQTLDPKLAQLLAAAQSPTAPAAAPSAAAPAPGNEPATVAVVKPGKDGASPADATPAPVAAAVSAGVAAPTVQAKAAKALQSLDPAEVPRSAASQRSAVTMAAAPDSKLEPTTGAAAAAAVALPAAAVSSQPSAEKAAAAATPTRAPEAPSAASAEPPTAKAAAPAVSGTLQAPAKQQAKEQVTVQAASAPASGVAHAALAKKAAAASSAARVPLKKGKAARQLLQRRGIIEAAAFTLLVGAFVTKSSLNDAVKKVKSVGLKPVVEMGDKKMEPMVRLYVAEFPSQALARKEIEKLKSAKVDGFFLKDEDGKYRVYAGSYASEKRAEAERDRGAALGVSLTLKQVMVAVPTFLLVAGSFPTRESALGLAAKLEAQGLKVEVAEIAGADAP